MDLARERWIEGRGEKGRRKKRERGRGGDVRAQRRSNNIGVLRLNVITLPYFYSVQEPHDKRSTPLLQTIWQSKNDEC